jgi:polar amino acid transport system permease protein
VTEPVVADDPPFTPSETEQARRDYRRQAGRRSSTIAAVSTVVVLAALWLGVSHTPGWSQAHQSFFDGSEFRSKVGGVAKAFLVNLFIMVTAEPCVLIVGLIVALSRTSRSAVLMPVRILAAVYVDVFRGCPLIIELYLFGLGIPSLRLGWLPSSAILWGEIAIIGNYASYVSEVFRAGIQSVHASQRAAARSLGLTQRQTLRLVVLPQAVRNVLPALLNDFIALQKDVGLIAIVGGTTDAVQKATINNSLDFNFTSFVIAALLFIALAVPTRWIADWYVRRRYGVVLAGAVV